MINKVALPNVFEGVFTFYFNFVIERKYFINIFGVEKLIIECGFELDF